MGVGGVVGQHREAPVEIGNELRRIRIGPGPVRDAQQAQFFDQAVLQSLVGAFNAALGLGGIGADDLDVQLLHRAAKLGQTRARNGVFRIDAEDAVFVAVKGARLAVERQVALHSGTVAEKALLGGEIQLE